MSPHIIYPLGFEHGHSIRPAASNQKTYIFNHTFNTLVNCVNITIRNLHERTFRSLKAKAAEEDMKLGDALTQAIELWVKTRSRKPKGRLTDIPTFGWGKGTEHSSTEIDKVLYG